MIKADHKKWARALFNIYIERELKKNFTNFYQANNFPRIPANTGLIITPNHISWWDGFFIDYVARKYLNRKLHIMMLEEQLVKYPFFSKLGAYSIIPGNSRSILETARYSREIINRPSNFVVTYPQGEIELFEQRPLGIKEGLKILIKDLKIKTFVLPVAFKIQPYNEKYPALITRFGKLLEEEEILKDFELFKSEFYGNLQRLTESAVDKKFASDLFSIKPEFP